MAYTKPGSEVTYVQKTAAPNLDTPLLPAAIVGECYYVHEITENPDSVYKDSYPDTYNNSTGTTVSFSGLIGDGTNVDTESVYVDVVSTLGARKPLDTTEFYVNPDGTDVTISGSLGSTYDGGSILIGWRELRTNVNSVVLFESLDDVTNRCGKIDPLNPLAFGLRLALNNAGKAVYGYGVDGQTATDHEEAQEAFALQTEPYAFAPLTTNTTIRGTWQTHCVNMSATAAKKERIVFFGNTISWVDSDDVATTAALVDSGGKTKTMQNIKSAAISNLQERARWVYPDTLYFSVRWHVSQLTTNYINNINGSLALNALLEERVTLSDGTILYADTEITETVRQQLIDSDKFFVNVLIPLPSYYGAAMAAGRRSGVAPQQPLTNLPLSGAARLKYASDFLSETQIDTAAGGGTWWLYQVTKNAPIVTRHQLSTDRSDTKRQEDSIRASLDYTGKFLRSSVSGLIGRNVISPSFLKLLATTITAVGKHLVREGVLNSFTLVTLYSEDDTVYANIDVEVKFPVNKISFTVGF